MEEREKELKKLLRVLDWYYEEDEEYTEEDSKEYWQEMKEREREYWNSQF